MFELIYYCLLFILVATLIQASLQDIWFRKVPFKTWYMLIIIGTLIDIIFIYLNYSTFNLVTNAIIITTVIIFYLCGYFKLYGGSDAWALIFITLFSISIPFNSMLNNAHMGIGVSTYINAIIIYGLTYPLYNYIFKKNSKAPFMVYITLGFLFTIVIGDIYNYIIGVIL